VFHSRCCRQRPCLWRSLLGSSPPGSDTPHQLPPFTHATWAGAGFGAQQQPMWAKPGVRMWCVCMLLCSVQRGPSTCSTGRRNARSGTPTAVAPVQSGMGDRQSGLGITQQQCGAALAVCSASSGNTSCGCRSEADTCGFTAKRLWVFIAPQLPLHGPSRSVVCNQGGCGVW
jgi:hypothetical protein